jgi:hypothetical protein
MGEKIKETAEEYLHDLRKAGGRVWEATQKTVAAAGTRATEYGKVVQRKLDLSSVDRKIDDCYRELGRIAFVAQRSGERNLFARTDVVDLLAKLDDLGEQRSACLQEIDRLRGKSSPTSESSVQAPPAETGPSAEAEEQRHL